MREASEPAPHEGQAAFLEDFLELAVLAKPAVENGEDNVGRRVEGGQVVGRDVRLGDYVSQFADRGGDRSAAGETDLPLGRRAATQDGDSPWASLEGAERSDMVLSCARNLPEMLPRFRHDHSAQGQQRDEVGDRHRRVGDVGQAPDQPKAEDPVANRVPFGRRSPAVQYQGRHTNWRPIIVSRPGPLKRRTENAGTRKKVAGRSACGPSE